MTPRQLFKAAFLAHCAAAGLSPEETLAEAQAARTKLAGLSDFWTTPYNKLWDVGADAAKNLVNNAKFLGGAGLVAAPFVVGGGLGYGAAKLTDLSDTDPRETKDQELLAEYRRLIDHVRRQRAGMGAPHELHRPRI